MRGEAKRSVGKREKRGQNNNRGERGKGRIRTLTCGKREQELSGMNTRFSISNA